MAEMRGTLRGIVGSLALAASLIAHGVAPGPAVGAPGELDRGFGENGRVVTQTVLDGHTWLDSHVHLAGAPDGTILAAVGKAIFRYLPDGSLDPSFGEGGRAILPADVEGLPFSLSDIDVDPDGRVVLFGEAEFPGIRLLASYIGTTIPLTQAAIVRYDRNGLVDRSFGSDGVVVTDFGQRPYYRGPMPPPGEPGDPRFSKAVTGIASGSVNAFGGLTVLGRVTELEGCIRSAARPANRVVARFTSTGDFDPSFGGGDGVASNLGFSDIWGLAATPEGGEMLAGPSIASRLCKGSPPGEAPVPELVSRLAPDGSVDASFATNGFRPVPLTRPFNAMAVGSQGRLNLLANSAVLRLRGEGGIDRRFGDRGTAPVTATHIDLQTLSPLGRGRLVLAGAHLVPRRYTGPVPQSFAVTKWTSSGRPDRGFGRRGWITTRFGSRSNAEGQEAFVDAEGRLVVAGPISRPDLAPTGGIALARYRLGP